MTQTYCVKCKKKVTPLNPQMKITKNGRHMIQGKCPICGTKTAVFVKKK